jgi:hypothetical protein
MSERLEVSARKRGEHGGESYLSQRSYYVYCHAHTARTAVPVPTSAVPTPVQYVFVLSRPVNTRHRM